jgi:hypothetical protein
MVPGTLADMRLQIDTLKFSLWAFRVEGCTANRFTIIGAEPVDISAFSIRVWKEAWTVSRCGTPVTRFISFFPGREGGMTMFVEIPGKESH